LVSDVGERSGEAERKGTRDYDCGPRTREWGLGIDDLKKELPVYLKLTLH
jgi:hypothetical protein